MNVDDEYSKIVNKYLLGRDLLDEKAIDDWEDPKSNIYQVTDRYGFIHAEKLPDKLPEYENKLKIQENRRLNKWLKMVKSWDQYFPNSEKLRSRTYKGIPNALRGSVWGRLLNVNQLKLEQSGKYQEMLQHGLEYSKEIKQIDLDVNRTYRNHIMFCIRYNTKQQMLFNVLVAYSVYNSEIGYCQGMSQIAALLLMYMDEEDAFWSLSSLMSAEKHAMHGFFIPGFPKLQRFSAHHDKIIAKFLPKLSKHFRKYDINTTLYTLKWFFQCFLDRVPFSLTLRIWDVFLLDGEIILTGMSYTLLKLHKRVLLKKNMEDTIQFLQIELEKDFGYHDDSAIQALQQSIQELKKYKMLYPEKPDINELPAKPFGFLVHERLGFDEQSIAGSVNLRVNDASSVATSRTSPSGSQQELRSISTYDNVSINESIEAAKRLSRLSNHSNVTPSKSPNNLHETSLKVSPTPNDTSINESKNYDAQSLSTIEDEINHLSADLDKQLNCGPNSVNSSTQKHEMILKTSVETKPSSPSVFNPSDISSNNNLTPTKPIIAKSATHNNKNVTNNHTTSSNNVEMVVMSVVPPKTILENAKIVQNETIVTGKRMTSVVSTSSYSKTYSPPPPPPSGNELNHHLNPLISILNNANQMKSNSSDNHVQVDINTSTVNSDLNETINQMSPSKIRIFVPYPNETNDGNQSSSTTTTTVAAAASTQADNPSAQNDLPIVET